MARLSNSDFDAMFVSPVRDVSGEVPFVDIWPYVDAIPRGEIGVLGPLDRLVDRVYRSGDSRFHHFLIRTSASNVYLAVVTAGADSSIFGHHVLDLNEKYGLEAPALYRAWHAAGRICAEHGVESASPMSMDSVHIALKTLHEAPINALRRPPAGSTSGWCIWGGETSSPDPDSFRPLHVSRLAERSPTVAAYLALPPGWRFLLGANGSVAWYDEQLLVD